MKKLMLIALTVLMTSCGFEIVDTGHRGIYVNLGQVIGEPLPEGLHYYNPFTSDVVEIDVREQKLEHTTACFTKDTQNVQITFAMTYYPDPTKIGQIYKQFGVDWGEKIIIPATLGSIKDTVGQYIADDLVSKREAAKNAAFQELKQELGTRGIYVTRLDLTNLNFDDAYERAVEQKVIAVQKAAEAKNKTVEIEEQSKQKVISAEAEAKSMRIRSQALSENKSLVEYEAVQKWNGVLPQYMMGSSTPFIKLGDK